MLARARATTADAAILYSRADMERLALPVAAFDLVYSSLALHYVVDLEWLLSEAHRRSCREAAWCSRWSIR